MAHKPERDLRLLRGLYDLGGGPFSDRWKMNDGIVLQSGKRWRTEGWSTTTKEFDQLPSFDVVQLYIGGYDVNGDHMDSIHWHSRCMKVMRGRVYSVRFFGFSLLHASWRNAPTTVSNSWLLGMSK